MTAAILVATTFAFLAYHYGAVPWGPLPSRWIGGALFAVLPLAASVAWGAGPADLGVIPTLPLQAIGFGVLVGLAVQPFIAINARGSSFQEVYPQLREPGRWSWPLFARSALGTVVYLVGYELMFRGVLLHGLLSLGTANAVAAMLALYLLVHLPKPFSETAGSAPMGLVFAWMSLSTGSFLGPAIAHILIALGNDAWVLWWTDRLPRVGSAP